MVWNNKNNSISPWMILQNSKYLNMFQNLLTDQYRSLSIEYFIFVDAENISASLLWFAISTFTQQCSTIDNKTAKKRINLGGASNSHLFDIIIIIIFVYEILFGVHLFLYCQKWVKIWCKVSNFELKCQQWCNKNASVSEWIQLILIMLIIFFFVQLGPRHNRQIPSLL